MPTHTHPTRRLGANGPEITTIGFGAWAIGGGDWAFGWGSQDDRDSVAAIHRALEGGVNWIDTAAVYGLGHSEEVVRRALEGVGGTPTQADQASALVEGFQAAFAGGAALMVLGVVILATYVRRRDVAEIVPSEAPAHAGL